MPQDSLDIAFHGGFDSLAFTRMEADDEMVYDNDTGRVDDLLDGGDHGEDCPRHLRYKAPRQQQPDLPYKAMLQHIEDQGFQRPSGGRRVR